MANKDYTYDNIRDGVVSGYFQQESGQDPSPSVRRLQTKLNRYGLDCGTPDGYFGSNTRNAVIAFQQRMALHVDGLAGKDTLKKLDALVSDTQDELYGRELTHAELIASYSSMNTIEALARTIYGEDSVYTDGQSAVAREIYNRKNATSIEFGDKCPPNQTNRTWKDVVFDTPKQYTVMSGPSSETGNSRGPNQYSTSWAHCISLAKQLVNGTCPESDLGYRYFHLSAESTMPSSGIYNYVQIPDKVGNQFFNYASTMFS